MCEGSPGCACPRRYALTSHTSTRSAEAGLPSPWPVAVRASASAAYASRGSSRPSRLHARRRRSVSASRRLTNGIPTSRIRGAWTTVERGDRLERGCAHRAPSTRPAARANRRRRRTQPVGARRTMPRVPRPAPRALRKPCGFSPLQ
jgi:hypothetical protein